MMTMNLKLIVLTPAGRDSACPRRPTVESPYQRPRLAALAGIVGEACSMWGRLTPLRSIRM
jgi:hypothetical protein